MSGHDQTFFDAYGEQPAARDQQQASPRRVAPVRRKPKSSPSVQNYSDSMDLYSDGQHSRVDPPINDPYQGRIPSPHLHFASGANTPQPAEPPATNFEPVASSAIRIEEDGPYSPPAAFDAVVQNPPEPAVATEPQIQAEPYYPPLAPAQANELAVSQQPLAATQHPVVQDRVTEQPVIQQPAIEQPAIEQPIVETLASAKSVVEESVVDESVVDQSVVDQSVVDQSVVDQSVVEESVVDESVVEESVVEESVVDESVVEESVSQPVADATT
ncbi:MAG: hypothetical protein ACI9HK_004170, partial [Pirellulaceae bacterium]